MDTWLIIILVNLGVSMIIGFALYIWRNQEGRVKSLELKNGINVARQLEHPLLTVSVHENLCKDASDRTRAIIKTQTDLLIQQISDGEKRTGLLIENAILKIYKKGLDER